MTKSAGFSYQYDAHGLLGIWSNVELGQFPRSFRKEVENPDIVVSLLMKPPPNRPGSFRFTYSPLKNLSTTVSIVDDSERLTLEVSDDLRRITGTLRPALSTLISGMFYAKLLVKGCLLLHGAVLEKEGRGVLVAAPAETGKTATTISLVRNSDYKFISDDMSIVKGIRFLSFPIDLKIESMDSLHGAPIAGGKRLEHAWRKAVRSLPFSPQLFAAGFYLRPEDVFGGASADETVVDTIVFLEHGPEGVSKVDKTEALDRLLSQHRVGIGSFDPFRNEIFLRYTYASDKMHFGVLAKREMQICEELVGRTKCFVVTSRGYDFDKRIVSLMSGRGGIS